MTVVVLRILVVGFAAYRLARAIAVDAITQPIRQWIWARAFSIEGRTADGDMLTSTQSRPWAWCYGLVSCPFCCSWWIALAGYATWLHVGPARPFIGAVAVAGVAALLVGFDHAANREPDA